jgi:hypothetical protein
MSIDGRPPHVNLASILKVESQVRCYRSVSGRHLIGLPGSPIFCNWQPFHNSIS